MDEIIKKYLEFVKIRISDWGYSDIDGFVEDERLNDEDIDKILNLSVYVSIEKSDKCPTEVVCWEDAMKKIEWLREGYKDIEEWISHVDMTSSVEALQVVINEIIGIYKQALKEGING